MKVYKGMDNDRKLCQTSYETGFITHLLPNIRLASMNCGQKSSSSGNWFTQYKKVPFSIKKLIFTFVFKYCIPLHTDVAILYVNFSVMLRKFSVFILLFYFIIKTLSSCDYYHFRMLLIVHLPSDGHLVT